MQRSRIRDSSNENGSLQWLIIESIHHAAYGKLLQHSAITLCLNVLAIIGAIEYWALVGKVGLFTPDR